MTWDRHSCLVIGVSRGLGAALTDGLLRLGSTRVVGVSRTPLGDIPGSAGWTRTGRYHHAALDIASADAPARLADAIAGLPAGPLLVIHNAAAVKSDVRPDGRVDFDAFDEVNAVGVTGLGHVLRAVEPSLLARGGIFAAISSYSALAPAVADPRIAYPATKAYLDMTCRALRHAWRGRARVVTVHLGRIGGAGDGLASRLFHPSYRAAAHRILSALTARRVPASVEYPLPYALVYRWILPHVPDALYFRLFETLLGGRRR